MAENTNVMFGREGTAVAQNRVLRNTYLLLAISLIPTALGAAVGLALNLPMPTGIVGFLVFLAVVMGFTYGIEKTKNSSMGIVLLLALTFVLGLFLSRMLGWVLGYKNGAQIIGMAAGGTAAIFAAMAAIGTSIKKDLSGMGKFLVIGMIMILVAALANFFFQSSVLMIALSLLCIGLMSAWLVYDINQIVKGGETNYVTATLSIYLSLFNIFQNLLALLGIGFGERD